jgi:uncharacterized membrane protein
MKFLAEYIDALIPLVGALLLLASPQAFTKKDLKAEENKTLARRFRMIGWLLLAAGVLILIASLGSQLGRR